MNKLFTRVSTGLLALCLLFGLAAPVAASEEPVLDTTPVETTAPEETAAQEPAAEPSAEDAAPASEEPAAVETTTKDYATFLAALKVLEGYAGSYVSANGGDAKELVINYIRTGVERYTEGNWVTLAGEEKTAFVEYVAQQDAANGTNAAVLRDLASFTLPNGNGVDFGHMFGTLNIAYINVQASADLGGWAGDVCDLMLYSKQLGDVPEGTVEEMAAYILENCFGVEVSDAFGMDDFYGDMDAFYLISQIKGTDKVLSAVAESYFTDSLSNEQRAEYFMKNRFQNLYTPESVRTAVYDAYKANIGLQVLEADRGLSDDADLRTAACYAFADYLYSLAGSTLEEPEEGGEEDPAPDTGSHLDVYSQTDSILAPGITQSINYAYNSSGKQVAYYFSIIDVNRDDVHVFANYKDNDPSKGWGMQRLVDQMNAAQAAHSDPDSSKYIEDYRSIVGINADFYNMSTGEPTGVLIMDGVTYRTYKDAVPDANRNFFAILSDGTAMIGTKADLEAYQDQIQQAVGGSIIFIKDGQFVANSSSYYSDPGTRSCVGITADGKVMFLVADGRQEPYSVGATVAETAQIMLDAGCVIALHLDGGGSATYASKPAGSDTVKLVSSPSDGYQRSVSSTLVAVSTAKGTNELEYATITSDYDYLTIGTQLQMNATGVTNIGGNAPIPEGATWTVSDEAIGSVDENGLFTAAENGEVEVQLLLNGEILGSKKLNVVVPDNAAFEKESIMAVFGEPLVLPLQMSYKGNFVAFNEYDYYALLENESAGTLIGLTFVGDEIAGIRKVRAGALLLANQDVFAMITINVYNQDEATFDFSNATAGNRSFAWNREVSNSITQDNHIYQIVKPGESMEISYTFAIDMEALEVPSQLADLTYMLPGADAGANAFTLMLQLAERISTYSHVKVTATFDPNLDVDISGLKVVNEYFELREASLDPEANTLTIVCGWIDQTAAIDVATANPICILSGITAAPKEAAAWDANDQLLLANTGDVSYKIYLRANALYSFAQKPENQEKYGLVPFENTDIIINGATEKGAWFGQTYVDFEDDFFLDRTNRQGWGTVGSDTFYFVDNVPVTGLKLLPMPNDTAKQGFYEFGEDGALIAPVTGLVEYYGDLYYAVKGEMMTGWQILTDAEGTQKAYFFNTWNGKAVDGTQTIGGYTYQFTDRVLTRGEVVKTANGTRYMWAGAWASQQWLNIDGKIYYVGSSEYFDTGLKRRYSPEGDWLYYAFDEDGAWMQDFSGIYEWKGGTYLIEEGLVQANPGLFKLGDYYYYITTTNSLIKDRFYWISKTNGIVPEGSYYFNAQGHMTMPTTEPETPVDPPVTEPDTPETPAKNGIVSENGTLFYYVNGKLTYAGLIEIDGNYYYVKTTGEVINSRKYWITKTNGLLPEKSYTFDETGKIVFDTPVEPPVTEPETPVDPPVTEPDTDVKNGIVSENGSLYYYVNGKLTYAGLIEIDGYYYYVKTSCEVIHGKKYWISKTNGILPEKAYTFDETGKMLDFRPEDNDQPVEPPVTEPEPEVKNGIVAENGSLYYYENGKLTYAGLIIIDGDYYYVKTSCEVIHGKKYWISKTNGLLPEKAYTFDETGKIIF